MKKSEFTEEQWVRILREADATSTAEAARKRDISDQTIYVWREEFCGMVLDEAKKLRALEQENARLRKLAKRSAWSRSHSPRG